MGSDHQSSIHVRHVRGEGTWGHSRNDPIMDGVHDIIQKYLDMRKQKLEELGVKFQLRTGRRAFGQRTLDADIPIEDVSTTSGHASVVTTQRHYAGFRNDVSMNRMLDYNCKMNQKAP